MLLYTWKDVERKLLLNKKVWEDKILEIETYSSEIIIYIKSMDVINDVEMLLCELMDHKYDQQNKKINLEFEGEYLDVFFEQGDIVEHNVSGTPLFKKVLYQQSAYYNEMLSEDLPGVPVIAFHSYKGGVGRTLSLLAFVKAWSSLKNLKNSKRLLIIDSDIEAPGITWLTTKSEEPLFSYLDLLEVTQGKNNVDEIISLIADKVAELTVKIETEQSLVEHIVLPTYRYIEQLLDMYSSPESLALSYNKKYILAEVLSKLGEKLNADMVLIDLRAGLSEFSAPILFDPRVKKYLVTSTSYQSVKGTEILLQQLNKGLPLSENTLLPEILLTMVPEGLKPSDIISDLIAAYEKSETDENISLTDNLVTELPFASELVHLESLQHIMKNLEGREFYKRIYLIVQNNYFSDKGKSTEVDFNKRKSVIKSIHSLAKNQITAEGNAAFDVLMTEPIQNLIRKYRSNLPNTVIMGAKGSGKTFLYREILRNKYWENFILSVDQKEKGETGKKTIAVPLLASATATGFGEIMQEAVQNYNQYNLKGKINSSVYIDNHDLVLNYDRGNHDILGWKEIWKEIILQSLNHAYQSFEELESDLEEHKIQVIFLIDGLEEIFTQTISFQTEQNAIVALCRDMMNEIKVRYKNFGLMVFLRKDMARDSITVNFEQFNSLYNSVELKWSSTEALRLVVWLVSQAAPEFYQEEVAIELASGEIIERNLIKLWGRKLGKATSNEAYSSRWILAALSDFNGQLQARDIIRFLEYATKEVGKRVYDDRYLMPVEIKKAVSDCSNAKISEVKQEIKVLEPIFDKLDSAAEEKKILPFYNDTFNLTPAEEKIMKQEGYLKVENDKYYLPEIIRHALKFRYEKGARPKVLSLLLK
ncbi:AAA family ATPase [Enterocloster sp. OA13]|uniref:KGGVGR-motif variant AAA ATPase n=1 Tax=Enterocloster sp. OA13 TaxID=2914161 RepID=UPI00046F9C56|nr:AAA family ATPase [Enterocloster sp. OA13]